VRVDHLEKGGSEEEEVIDRQTAFCIKNYTKSRAVDDFLVFLC